MRYKVINSILETALAVNNYYDGLHKAIMYQFLLDLN